MKAFPFIHLFLLSKGMPDLLLDILRQRLHVPGVVLLPGRGQDALHVDLLHPRVVLILAAVDVSEESSHGVEDGLGSAGVPFLTARAGEHVGAGLALHQEDHLVPGPAHLQHLVWFEDVQSLLDEAGAVTPGGGDHSLAGRGAGRDAPQFASCGEDLDL